MSFIICNINRYSSCILKELIIFSFIHGIDSNLTVVNVHSQLVKLLLLHYCTKDSYDTCVTEIYGDEMVKP